MTDREIVNGILNGEEEIIKYFFFTKCSRLFSYIILSVFGGKAHKNELMNELFLYIAKDDWKKLKEFDFRSSLLTWISVVSVRFFIKKRDLLIEKESTETLIKEDRYEFDNLNSITMKIDLDYAMAHISNPRYREVITLLDIEDKSYEEVARILNVSISNLYNIHRRALAQLKLLLI